MTSHLGSRAGFTLIELLVVVMIIGVLASLGVSQYFKVVERSKAAEAVGVAMAIKSAQERYKTKYGAYCNATISSCVGLDLDLPALKYFNNVTALAAGTGAPSWKVTISRKTSMPVYGAYTVTYDSGSGAGAFTCSQSNCQNELLPK